MFAFSGEGQASEHEVIERHSGAAGCRGPEQKIAGQRLNRIELDLRTRRSDIANAIFGVEQDPRYQISQNGEG